MAHRDTPSEFGGRAQRNRVQPRPHVPTRSEALMLGYTTGDENGLTAPDGGEVFQGLLPKTEQEKLRKETGDLDKGQVWEELKQKAQEA